MVRHARGKVQRAAGQRVVHSAASGGAAVDRVIHRHRLAGDSGERDGQISWRDRFGPAGTGQIEGDGGRIVIVKDGAGADAVGDGGAGRVAEVDREGFIQFVDVVAIDNDCDGLRRG